jgi:hypothetical protein
VLRTVFAFFVSSWFRFFVVLYRSTCGLLQLVEQGLNNFDQLFLCDR